MITAVRRALLRQVRDVLWRLQGGLCAGCGLAMRRRWTTLDHVIPRSRGGFDGFGDVVAMHRDCNQAKRDRWPTGCELIWLLAVNARLGVGPQRWAA